MNQILDTKKIYVTPKIKRAKKFYKINFIVSVFLVCFLSSYYIYAEYDKTRAEEVAKQLLQEMEYAGEYIPLEPEQDVIMIILDENRISFQEEAVETTQEEKEHAMEEYEPIAQINIEKINVNYSILSQPPSEKIDELMKISPIKFYGANPNEIGNFCIAGHNYRNNKFFSKVPTLNIGDTIDITDKKGKTVTYKIYSKYEVIPTDTSCLEQNTNGRREITIITCTNDNKKRVIIKANEI